MASQWQLLKEVKFGFSFLRRVAWNEKGMTEGVLKLLLQSTRGRDDRHGATSFLGTCWDQPHLVVSDTCFSRYDPGDGHSFPEFTQTEEYSCRICSLLR